MIAYTTFGTNTNHGQGQGPFYAGVLGVGKSQGQVFIRQRSQFQHRAGTSQSFAICHAFVDGNGATVGNGMWFSLMAAGREKTRLRVCTPRRWK